MRNQPVRIEFSQAEIALLLGVCPRTIWNWQQAGMPYIPRKMNGSKNRYFLPELIAWMVNREREKAKARFESRDSWNLVGFFPKSGNEIKKAGGKANVQGQNR